MGQVDLSVSLQSNRPAELRIEIRALSEACRSFCFHGESYGFSRCIVLSSVYGARPVCGCFNRRTGLQ